MKPTPPDSSKRPSQSSHLDEDSCLSLLHGLLPRDAAEELLAHMAECPECESLFLERAGERERLRASRVLRSLPNGELVLERREDATAEGPETEAPRTPREAGWVLVWESMRARLRRPAVNIPLGLAAAAAVLLLVILPRPAGPPDVPALGWLPSYRAGVVPRPVEPGEPSPDLLAGMTAYDERQIEAAIEHFQRATDADVARPVYLGSALAHNQQYAEAATILSRLKPESVIDEWFVATYQTLYVALMRSGSESQADSLLQAIAGEQGEFGQWARDLIQGKD